MEYFMCFQLIAHGMRYLPNSEHGSKLNAGIKDGNETGLLTKSGLVVHVGMAVLSGNHNLGNYLFTEGSRG
jgi:hypothetical protein